MSLKEIAELAGASVSTVSRVLNHEQHRCNEAGLYERIWEAAAALHYVPNPAARALRSGRQETGEPFAVDIFLARFDSFDQDAFFQELFCHIRQELVAAGCLLGEVLHPVDIMDLSNGSHPVKSIPYRGDPRGANGANVPAVVPRKENTGLMILGKCPANLIPVLRKRYACMAGIDRNPTEYEYDEVVCNGATAAEKAVEYLISLGHTNIAYIGDCTYEARYIGYYQTLLNHKLPLNHTNVWPTDQTKEEGYKTMLAMLAGDMRPTAVFCANDSTALGVLQALRQHRKKDWVPSVISIDNIADSEKTSPMLTTIDIPKKEMSHLALSLLLDRRDKLHAENVRIELPCRLVERESCTWI